MEWRLVIHENFHFLVCLLRIRGECHLKITEKNKNKTKKTNFDNSMRKCAREVRKKNCYVIVERNGARSDDISVLRETKWVVAAKIHCLRNYVMKWSYKNMEFELILIKFINHLINNRKIWLKRKNKYIWVWQYLKRPVNSLSILKGCLSNK